MITRMRATIRQRDSRRFFYAYLSGKMLGLGLAIGGLFAFTWFFSNAAGATPAAGTPAIASLQIVNAVNTSWTLVAAFLVFCMQAGFMMLEAGFARTREAGNILAECIVDTCLCGILFWAVGFAFMFSHGNGWIGYHWFFLQNIPATYETTGVSFLAFWLFQFAFADTASTIVSGAMVGRTAFKGDLLYSLGVSGLIYPILGHWVWGPNGWLATLNTPFRDFAGSTVVHTVGGMLALTGAIALGPRLGRVFKRDGGGLPPGHDMVIAAFGGLILWFGWYGFNPGSTLSALDYNGIGRVATNTTLAACAGGLIAMFLVYPRSKKWDIGITTNGFLAGLVAITCPCYWVSPFGSVMIGIVAAIVCVLSIDFIEWLRVDDPIGAVAVHGFAGIWGTLSLGLFATGSYGLPGQLGSDRSIRITGLFYGGGGKQLVAQITGSAVMTGATLASGFALMYLIKAFGLLRISEEGEIEGLDIHDHGAPAYHPETAYTGWSTTGGGGVTVEPPVLSGSAE